MPFSDLKTAIKELTHTENLSLSTIISSIEADITAAQAAGVKCDKIFAKINAYLEQRGQQPVSNEVLRATLSRCRKKMKLHTKTQPKPSEKLPKTESPTPSRQTPPTNTPQSAPPTKKFEWDLSKRKSIDELWFGPEGNPNKPTPVPAPIETTLKSKPKPKPEIKQEQIKQEPKLELKSEPIPERVGESSNRPQVRNFTPPESDSENYTLADNEMHMKIIRRRGQWVLDLMLEAIPNPEDYRGKQVTRLAYVLATAGEKAVKAAVLNPKEDLFPFAAPLLLKEEARLKNPRGVFSPREPKA
jgi:hypothetical protein